MKKIFNRTKAEKESIPFNNAEPLTGGNELLTQQKLRAQDDLDRNTIPQTISEDAKKFLNELFATKNYDIWRSLMFEANYFCNQIPFETKDKKLNYAINQMLRISFLYGDAFLEIKDGNYLPLYIMNRECDKFGNITHATCIPAVDVLSAKSLKVDAHFTINYGKKDLENCILLKWDTLSYGAIFNLLPYLNQKMDLLAMINTYAISFIRKFSQTVENPYKTREDMENWFNVNLPFHVKNGSIGMEENTIKEEMVNANGGTSKDVIDYYNKWNQVWCEIIGKEINTGAKKEREVSGEIDINNAIFTILKQEHLTYFRNFIDEVQEKTSEDIFIIEDVVNKNEINEDNIDRESDSDE